MSEIKFDETKIPENYSKTLIGRNLIYPAPYTNKIGKVIMDAISRCLGSIKDISVPKAIAFKSIDGSFLAAGIVKYHKNEDDPDNLAAGNWSYNWTFNEEDLKDANVIYATDALVIPFFEASASNLFHMKFNENSTATMVTVFIEILLGWLSENAKDGTVVTVDLPGAFKASCEVVDGKVEKALVPDGNVKTLIKGDEMIQDE